MVLSFNKPTLDTADTSKLEVSASDSAEVWERIIHVDTSGGAVTLTLPNAGEVEPGAIFLVDVHTVGNALTISGTGNTTKTDATLDAAGDSAMCVSDGGDWLILSDVA